MSDITKPAWSERAIRGLALRLVYGIAVGVTTVASPVASLQAAPPLQAEAQANALEFLSRGAERLRARDYHGALADLDQALRLDPSLTPAYSARASARFGLEDYQGAIDDDNQVLSLDPNNAAAYVGRGAARRRLGDTQGAISDYTQGLRLDPTNAVAYYNRGAARAILRDDPGALADYSEALRLNPNYAPIYSGLGGLRARQGDAQGAIELYTEALRLDPSYADAYANRGLSRERLGDWQGALQDFRDTLQHSPIASTRQSAQNAIRRLEAPRAPAAPSGPPALGTGATGAASPTRTVGRALYQDDFADSASGWPRQPSDPAQLSYGYDAGEYFVLRPARQPGASWVSRTREGFSDLQIEVDARLVAPTEGAYVSLGFRRQPNGDHYAFVVAPDDGTFRLLRREQEGSTSTALVGRTRATVVQPGTMPNRLGVWVRDSDIILLVNGHEVGWARDERFRQGTLTLGVGHRADGAAEARFSHLVVTSAD